MDGRNSVAILAAGLGTRMRSRLAKVLHRAGGKALVEHVVATARAVAPAENVAVIVGHQADRVRAALEPQGVRFAEQREQKGTGHALKMCRPVLEGAGEYLLVLSGDAPMLRAETVKRLMAAQQSSNAAATVLTAVVPDPTGYGRILRNAAGNVEAIVEQKAGTAEQLAIREINSGIYCFRTSLLWNNLEKIEPNPASGEYYLTDMVELLVSRGETFAAVQLEDPNELLGINTRVELADADRILRTRKARELMLSGVTIEKPETVSIDVDVEIGQDTVIEGFAQILGATKIGSECRVGACSIVRDTVMADGAAIEAFCHVVDSQLDAGAKVGPYARMRMHAHAAEGAVIGNFVELKKTRLGKGSKAQHLAYLGDSTIGEKSNIGAGTITCNYDGEKKHETQIGDRAFVGSNSTLVAPVSIGDDSYVAAGSVITDGVEPDTLALGRARQVNKPGWPSRRKAKRPKA
jgi:bifunctional UDP-N-acetylglucosamine pyrophosphorylase/glucosamine-1-phosphate N-acetyltransferase